MLFARLVFYKFLHFRVDFDNFAPKSKKYCFWWLPFDISVYKEAKNNNLVVTIKKLEL